MAHLPNPWLTLPQTDSNFPRCNFNVNPGNIQSPMQPFQRNSVVPFHSFQVSSPPPVSPGTFPGRPRFPNFGDPATTPGFRTILPGFERMPPPNMPFPNMPPPNMPPPNIPHPNIPPPNMTPLRSHFPAAATFENRPTPWRQTETFFRNRPPFLNRPRPPYPSTTRDVPFSRFKKEGRKFKKKDNRKLKDDATEKPFYCDTCDRAYVLESELQSHLSEHITCDSAGCCYQAHPKIVALHKKMQHDTGYADVINKLQDTEEIKKWREERRKHFPTAENIKKRKAEQIEKEARGEVLETKEFGKFKRRKNDHNFIKNKDMRKSGNRYRRHASKASSSHQRRDVNFSQPGPKVVVTVSDSESDSDSHITLNKFLGMSVLNSSNVVSNVLDFSNQNVDSLDLQHENVHEVEKLSIVDKQPLIDKISESCHVPPIHKISHQFSNLSNEAMESDLLCQLNGSSMKDSAELHTTETVKSPSGANSLSARVVTNSACSNEIVKIESDDEPPTAIPILKAPLIEISNSIDGPDRETFSSKCDANPKHSEKVKEKIYPQHFEKNNERKDASSLAVRKSTLLEKLLADDIRHERNVILQCIRHVVKKKFFGIGGAVHWKSP